MILTMSANRRPCCGEDLRGRRSRQANAYFILTTRLSALGSPGFSASSLSRV